MTRPGSSGSPRDAPVPEGLRDIPASPPPFRRVEPTQPTRQHPTPINRSDAHPGARGPVDRACVGHAHVRRARATPTAPEGPRDPGVHRAVPDPSRDPARRDRRSRPARPRPDRLRQDARVRAGRTGQARRRAGAPAPSPWAGPGANPRARHPGRRRAPPVHQGTRTVGGRRGRRYVLPPPVRRAAARRRPARRHAGAPRRPPRPGHLRSATS
mgnify:CR=1 FL=1